MSWFRFNLRTAVLAMLVLGIVLGIAGRRWRDYQLDQLGQARLRQIARAYLFYRRESHPDGLSWRVHLLPALGEETLYHKFRLDEPWYSRHNLSLLSEMPDIYHVPESSLPRGQTAVFCRELGDHHTVFVHAFDDQSVPWTRPDGWGPDFEEPADPRGVRRQLVRGGG